ncbi:MAG TPA: hypothetical protein VNJ01_11490 [Bacteriovoracaceae bacterium]|nr:hypothetical protein [Bacteriovoracaceae bacterium]
MLKATSAEREFEISESLMARTILRKYPCSKILESYFNRLHSTQSYEIPEDQSELYTLELEEVKDFLLSQHPMDDLFQKILHLSN